MAAHIMLNYRFSTIFGVLAVLAQLTAPANAVEAVSDLSTEREFNAKLLVCNACHGEAGRAKYPTIPIISGLDENYILKQLRDFRSGERDVEVMAWAAKILHEPEVTPAVAYFAKQNWPARSVAVASSSPPRGVALCQACHNTDYLGARQAEGQVTPRLAGQSYEYLVEAMRAFADGERKNNATMMQLMAAISPEEREAMARYLSGR